MVLILLIALPFIIPFLWALEGYIVSEMKAARELSATETRRIEASCDRLTLHVREWP